MRDRGDRLLAAKSLPRAALALDAHVHRGVTLHRSCEALLSLGLRRLEQLFSQEEPEGRGEQDDHQRPTDELGQRELPADGKGEDDAELDDEVCRGDLERHRGREAGPLAEQRTGESDSRVRA